MALSQEQLTKMYGAEYPEAITTRESRMPLSRESRFLRTYENPERRVSEQVSRFLDGSATITYRELKSLWPTWGRLERYDFTSASTWLHGC